MEVLKVKEFLERSNHQFKWSDDFPEGKAIVRLIDGREFVIDDEDFADLEILDSNGELEDHGGSFWLKKAYDDMIYVEIYMNDELHKIPINDFEVLEKKVSDQLSGKDPNSGAG